MYHFILAATEVIFCIFCGLFWSIIYGLGFFLPYTNAKLYTWFAFYIGTIFISLIIGIENASNAGSFHDICESIGYISYTINASIITILFAILTAKYNSEECKENKKS